MSKNLSTALNVVIIALVAVFVLTKIFPSPAIPAQPSTYSVILDNINKKEVKEALIDEDDQKIYVTFYEAGKPPKWASYPANDGKLVDDLYANSVSFVIAPREKAGLGSMLLSWLPMLLLVGVWIWFMKKQSGGGAGGMGSFGKSKAKSFSVGQTDVKFSDVAGIDEAKEEVAEIVDFLKDRERFLKVGGKPPCGILLTGDPGCGKTMLAKAIASEAGVPFFSASGSTFVEMFVGVGAARVRDLFDEAKKNIPCVVFIDEIDAVGRKRGSGIGGGNDEREQTLNQLLVEMDGFEGNEGIIVIAATNRPDVLDKALLRPGRFDRQVHVPLPDVRGREQILNVHARKIALGKDVELSIVARGTPGFSGADLGNLVNEAALMAARLRKDIVNMPDFEKAKDKIMMGAERRTMVMKDEEKKLTAYHEAGHTIVGWLSPSHDPVHKVSIIPRGRALGVTMYLPEEDKVSYTKEMLESQLKSLYGGRIAEELVFGVDKITTGASNDIQRATSLAMRMVKLWGFDSDVGPMAFYMDGDNAERHTSEKTAETLDGAIKGLIDRNYTMAETMLKDNVEKLHMIAAALLEHETIDNEQIRVIMEG